MGNLITLSHVLQSPDDFSWNHALYLPDDRAWGLDSRCAVCNPDDCDEDEQPEIAKENQLTYALGMSAVQDVVANARQQKSVCSLDDLIQAFLFYHKHDAFMTLK